MRSHAKWMVASVTEPFTDSLSVELYRGIVGTKGRALSTEDGSARHMIAEIESHFGSIADAAKAAGVPRSTWGFWRRGVRAPKADRLQGLQDLQRRLRLSATREAMLRRNHIVVHAAVQVSSEPVRDRRIHITGWPDRQGRPEIESPTGMSDRIVDAWLARDDAAVRKLFVRPLGAGVYGDLHLIQTYAVRWFPTKSAAESWLRRPARKKK